MGSDAKTTFKAKFNMTKEQNTLLAKRNIIDCIWKEANLEGFNITFPDTQAIYEMAKISSVEVDAVTCVLNLKHAWQYVFDNLDKPLTLDYLKGLHKEVAYRIALEAGELRNGTVSIGGCEIYQPPIPQQDNIVVCLDKINAISNPTEKALELFAWLCKDQLFWDGNKRTAQLAANKVLIENGAGLLSVSLNDLQEFGYKLHDFYEYDHKQELFEFLYDVALSGAEFSTKKPAQPKSSERTAY
jgi:Fic family protein